MEPLNAALRIGLTGGIGSGKTSAAQAFVALGATLIDTDAIARELTAAGGAALPALRAAFDADCFEPSGALDRAVMRRRAFADPGVRERLESILHPMIGRTAAELAERAAQARSPTIVFDVPLLTAASHWRARADRVLVIDCDVATQIERVSQRPGWSREAAERVVATQATRAQRRALADAVIHNDGRLTLDGLHAAVAALHGLWSQSVRGPVKQ